MRSWRESKLAGELFARQDAEKAQLAVSIYLPRIETVLTSGMPGSPDFTLHDSQHGFRVAETMASLLDSRLTLMSDIELVHLIFSAYCHDIGMSPSRSRIRSHYEYLITGNINTITPAEEQKLQNWLDTYRDGTVAPIAEEINVKGLRTAEELVAYYARSRHNDWSEEYIREELGSLPEQLYTGWIDDLVTICRSHHEGLTQLRQPRFDAKMVSNPSMPLNLRYLSAILRVADILEFAPERTPEVILLQRDIVPSSRIYWYKDHSISFSLNSKNGSMLFSAQTPSAVIHKAVLDTASDVDAELELCSTLDKEGAFSRGVINSEIKSQYEWPWANKLSTDIRELGGRFTYIDGAFRPNTQKVLGLLSGTALYGNPFVALRELAQNSLDAIREQTAYMRLASNISSDPTNILALSSLHQVTISFYQDEDRYWIRCSDNGSGMTKRIIERSLLISGNGARGDLRKLERDSKNRGFSLGRTGQFGIGVLSYFMIADKFVFITRRSQEAGDTDATGWKFVSDGLDGFGELTQESRFSRGTEVSLAIRSDLLGDDPHSWFAQAARYIAHVLRWTPCVVEIRDDINASDPLRLGPGWTSMPEGANETLLKLLFNLYSDSAVYPTLAEQQRIEKNVERNRKLSSAAAGSLVWYPSVIEESEATDSRIRVSLPYFDLQDGACAAFLQPGTNLLRNTGPGSVVSVRNLVQHSYFGFFVSRDSRKKLPMVEIDYGDGRKISVDRTNFVDKESNAVQKMCEGASQEIWRRFLIDNNESLYNELNVSLAPIDIKDKAGYLRSAPAWLIQMDDRWVWKVIDEPVFSLARLSFYVDEGYGFALTSGEKEAGWIGTTEYDDLHYLHSLYGGGSVVFYSWIDQGGMVGLKWNGPEGFIPLDGTISSASSAFPLSWSDVVAIRGERLIFNKDHWLAKENFEAIIRRHATDALREPKEIIKTALSSSSAAAEFILGALSAGLEFWVYLAETYSSDFRSILKSLGVSDDRRIQIIDASGLVDSDGLIDLMDVASSPGGNKRKIPKVSKNESLKSVNVPAAT